MAYCPALSRQGLCTLWLVRSLHATYSARNQAQAHGRQHALYGALLMAAAPKRTAWLSEKDVDFFTGGGPGETEVPMDPESQATVQVRAGTVP